MDKGIPDEISAAENEFQNTKVKVAETSAQMHKEAADAVVVDNAAAAARAKANAAKSTLHTAQKLLAQSGANADRKLKEEGKAEKQAESAQSVNDHAKKKLSVAKQVHKAAEEQLEQANLSLEFARKNLERTKVANTVAHENVKAERQDLEAAKTEMADSQIRQTKSKEMLLE